MAYCVNCGVELAKGATKCPLCNTPLYIPQNTDTTTEKDLLFPTMSADVIKHTNRRSLLELLSLVFFLPIPLLIFCNLNISGEITWAGLAVGAILLLYVLCVLPYVPKRGNAVHTIAFDAIGTLGYLWYIEYVTKGTWFLRFVLPLVLLFAISGIIIVVLKKYTNITPLTLTAITLLLLGLLCIAIEILLNICFSLRNFLLWSLYPFLALAFLSIVVLYINRNTNLKEKIKRKFIL